MRYEVRPCLRLDKPDWMVYDLEQQCIACYGWDRVKLERAIERANKTGGGDRHGTHGGNDSTD